jgi:hypothetical protein
LWLINTTSILGKADNGIGKGTSRLGPIKLKGEARSVKWGSVKMFRPPSCHSAVEWPTQVTLASLRLAFS